eukprot:COSAG01_NODE_73977_length_231_cov_29.431818_1_plen_50_part_10
MEVVLINILTACNVATTALRGVGEPVIVHYEDAQRLGHIQHRKRGKKNSV